jgi:hypothetical protein
MWVAMACVAVAAGAWVSTLRAEEKKAAGAADGTWKWTFTRNDQTVEMSVKLKQDGEKLTGVYVGRDKQETKIEDGKIKDAELSFTVKREINNQTVSQKFKGKIDGDTIKGTIESDFGGQTRSRDWEAKRAKE